MMADEDSLPEGSYSQLLFAADDGDVDVQGLNTIDFFNFSSLFSLENTQKMLCFGDFGEGNDLQLVQNAPQNSRMTCTPSPSSTPLHLSTDDNIYTKKNPSKPKPKKKRNDGSSQEPKMEEKSGEFQSSLSKKAKAETSISKGHSKVKRENLGGRITALQQIVSPFGKADTATVLHEARGYISFLHDQVQVLSSPYLHCLPSSANLSDIEEEMQRKPKRDLRSRGLCLVPVELTSNVAAENNGADLWSPAMVNHMSQNK